MKKAIVVGAVTAVSLSVSAYAGLFQSEEQKTVNKIISCAKEIQSAGHYTGCSESIFDKLEDQKAKVNQDEALEAWNKAGYTKEEALPIVAKVVFDNSCFVNPQEKTGNKFADAIMEGMCKMPFSDKAKKIAFK
jgi:hypothetical protein